MVVHTSCLRTYTHARTCTPRTVRSVEEHPYVGFAFDNAPKGALMHLHTFHIPHIRTMSLALRRSHFTHPRSVAHTSTPPPSPTPPPPFPHPLPCTTPPLSLIKTSSMPSYTHADTHDTQALSPSGPLKNLVAHTRRTHTPYTRTHEKLGCTH